MSGGAAGAVCRAVGGFGVLGGCCCNGLSRELQAGQHESGFSKTAEKRRTGRCAPWSSTTAGRVLSCPGSRRV